MEIVLMIPKYVGASEPLSYVFINGLQAKRYSKMPKKKNISYHLYAPR